jgi:hypothetical protein
MSKRPAEITVRAAALAAAIFGLSTGGSTPKLTFAVLILLDSSSSRFRGSKPADFSQKMAMKSEFWGRFA